MNDYYYLVGDEKEMEGPYNIDDIREFYNKQDPSFSQEKVVINLDTEHKSTIGEIINVQSINAQDKKGRTAFEILFLLTFCLGVVALIIIVLSIIYWVIAFVFCD